MRKLEVLEEHSLALSFDGAREVWQPRAHRQLRVTHGNLVRSILPDFLLLLMGKYGLV
jgi:hypothetical protein